MKIASKGMYRTNQTSDRAGRVINDQAMANFASAFIPADPGKTSLSGVVLNNQDQPLQGITLRIEGTTRQAVSNNHFIITSKFIGEKKYAVSVVPVAGKNLLKRKYLYEKDIFPVMPTFSANKDGAFLLDIGFREIIFSKLDINNFNSSTYSLPRKIKSAHAVRFFPVCNRKVCYIVTSAFTLKGNNNSAFDQVLVHEIQ